MKPTDFSVHATNFLMHYLNRPGIPGGSKL